VSGILSDYAIKGEMVKLGKGKSTVWGFKEYLNEDGTVKPEHVAL
jgi:hypothetical protein